MLLQASQPANVVEDRFSSDFMNTSGFCLEFHYLYHGPGVARLYVMVTDESLLSHTLWEASIKDSGLQWQYGVNELPHGVFQVNQITFCLLGTMSADIIVHVLPF